MYPEKAMKILEEGFEDSMTVMNFTSKQMRVVLRTTNKLERINREFKDALTLFRYFPTWLLYNDLWGLWQWNAMTHLELKNYSIYKT